MNENVDFNESFKRHTWKTSLIAVVCFVAGMILSSLTEAKAETGACFTPSMLQEQVADVAEKNNTVVTVNKWEGDDARVIREYIQSHVPNEIYEFDTVMTAVREGYDQTMIMVFKNGCSVFVTTIPASEIQKFKDIVRGT